MYGAPPKSPLQVGPNASLASGLGWPGDPLRQPWAGSLQVAPNATVQVARLDQEPYHAPRMVLLRVFGAPVELRIRERFLAGQVDIDHTCVLGPGGGWTLPASGPWSLRAVSLSAANTATVRWALLLGGEADMHSPYDFPVSGLTQGGGGSPGPWTNASDIGAGPRLGFPPPDRHQLSISGVGQLDFQFVDETGVAQWAFWQQTGPIVLKHPGRARLQVRHPGAAADTRGVICTWNRA